MSFLTSKAMPQLIYGTAWKKDKTSDLITKALKYGFRGIDTACQPKHYNEAGVGDAIKQLIQEGYLSRQDLYIQTKFTPVSGQDPFNIPYDPRAPLKEQVVQSFEVSKKNLGIGFLDGLILHSPLRNFEETITAWQALEGIFNTGGTRQIGLSNCYDLEMLKNLYEKADIKPTILQNRFYHETLYDKEIRKWCKEKKITYQSFWTLTANLHILLNPVVQRTARAYQKTPEQILFRYLIDIGVIPLTGTTSDQHMKEDLEILELKLPENAVQEISLIFP